MKVEQMKWTSRSNWQTMSGALSGKKAQLVLGFGDRFLLSNSERFNELKQFYPDAHIILASSSGNIQNINLDEESIVTTALAFEKESYVQVQKINIGDAVSSQTAGISLGSRLEKDGLRHVFLISDGHLVNGS